jgi:hypothetical protein
VAHWTCAGKIHKRGNHDAGCIIIIIIIAVVVIIIGNTQPAQRRSHLQLRNAPCMSSGCALLLLQLLLLLLHSLLPVLLDSQPAPLLLLQLGWLWQCFYLCQGAGLQPAGRQGASTTYC